MLNNKVIFIGTTSISKAILENLYLNKNINLIGVISQPDRPSNHLKIIYSPVKQYCIDNKITIIQPEKIKIIANQIRELKPDLIITCAYGQIINQEILDIPKFGCINVHPSLLPKYRGPTPINYALFNGDKKTGVTFMYMDKGMDTGDIIIKKEINILPQDNYTSLLEKLTIISCKILQENIINFFSDKVKRIKQNNNNATYSKMIDNETCHIQWDNKAQKIINLLRGLSDVNYPYVIYKGQNVKIGAMSLTKNKNYDNKIKNGTIINISKDGISVKVFNEILIITRLQIPGKKMIDFSQMFNGNHQFRLMESFE